MALTYERKLPLILTFVFFVLTIVGIFFYQNTLSLKQEKDWQNQTRDIVVRLDRVFTYSLDSDSASLGFILLANETYLDPINGGAAQYSDDLASLQGLLSTDEAQRAEFANLQTLLSQKDQLNKQLIEKRRQGSFPETMDGFPMARLQNYALQIRASIDRLKTRQLNILQTREASLDADMNRTVIVLIVSSIAGVIALIMANVMVMVENERRREADSKLIKANEELEAKVLERTRELQVANRNLLESASEREDLLAKEHSARRDAEIANRLRDEFMATVSHELRTPLNSILGWARLLKAGNLDARQSSKAVRTIVKNAESQNRLIEDLLDVARMISGKVELEIENVPVAEFVSHSIDTIRPVADKHHISIDLDVNDAVADKIIAGDRVRLEQVVGNLLTNAVKFSPDGSVINVDVRSDNGSVEIMVRDHGAGISKEFLPLVFERFRQDSATLKQSGGLGLGLAVVRNLTEMHGGTVRAESEGENLGASFTVSLPVAGRDGH